MLPFAFRAPLRGITVPDSARKLLMLSMAAASTVLGASRAPGASTTWANVDSDWLTSTNWTAGLPNASIQAVLPAAALRVDPDVASAASALGLSVNNSGGAYSITGGGTLSLGANGLSVSGGGTTTIACPIDLSASGAFDISSATTLMLT